MKDLTTLRATFTSAAHQPAVFSSFVTPQSLIQRKGNSSRLSCIVSYYPVCEWRYRVCLCLTGRMTPTPLWQRLRGRCAQPAVGLRVEHFDLVTVDLVVGVEGAEAVGSPSEHKHLCPDDGGRVEVSPASRSAL